ncbi:MAG: alanine--glyoxylate aminotransferase family protein [Candidatus Cloacimonadota bacterium]|nr:MAG: alanine--glyoxylate aminotransferase family protein [Candidatus Cloacimonadota bacterium]
MHKKLFIPGPTEVREDILDVMKTPMIGHRSKEFSELYDSVIPKVKKVFYTENKVFLSTSSATGLMEGAIRNCVKERALNLVCGAFSKRWHQITKANGKEADVVEVEWGKAILPEMVRDALKTGKYDAVTFVHNETSTGVMNPIYEIAEVMKEFPDVSFLVDAVSSMVGVKIEVDRLGIDVCLAGVQKAFALPPGLALCSVSEKALKKAESIPNRGYYFDFLTFLKYDQDKHQTPTTPIISIIFALDKQLDRFFEEGLENRFARHLEMANYVRDWTRQYFAFFPDEKYLSNTLTAIKNTRGISVADLNKELGKRGAMISNGYGKLKEQSFRIAHMGDLTLDDMKWLLSQINEILGL